MVDGKERLRLPLVHLNFLSELDRLDGNAIGEIFQRVLDIELFRYENQFSVVLLEDDVSGLGHDDFAVAFV